MNRPLMLRGPEMTGALLRDRRGTTAIEFALISVLLLLVTFGIIDFGLAFWQWNMAEKATQVGARKAIVSDFVAPCLANLTSGVSATINGVACTSTVTSTPGTPCVNSSGTILNECQFATVTCTNGSCSQFGFNQTAFNTILTEMKKVDPYVTAANLRVQYSQNGLGFVGRPNGLPVTVTVTLTGMTFRFFVINVLAGVPSGFTMPPFTATLIGEDFDSSSS